MSTTRYYPEPDNAAVRSAIPSEKAHPNGPTMSGNGHGPRNHQPATQPASGLQQALRCPRSGGKSRLHIGVLRLSVATQDFRCVASTVFRRLPNATARYREWLTLGCGHRVGHL